ncbi:hypothetical protein OIU78_024921 [Salix suchowensis]|nr:hypothetical protein OIU78_024921 [Salix suchowensis]
MPRPKAGEVLIKTKACGVCHSDLHVIKGEIPFPSPCAIVHEITGEVVEHGKLSDRKTIERFPVGSRVVGALWDFGNAAKSIKCGKPISMYSMRGLAILPNSLPYSVFTAYGAMPHAAQVRPGDPVAMIGIARAFGAFDIIAVDVQDEKLEKAKTFGATATINSKIEDPIEMIKVQVIGSYGGRARQDLPKLVKLAESGIFNLGDAVTRKYGFEEAGKAFQDLNQGKIVSRAVVEMM